MAAIAASASKASTAPPTISIDRVILNGEVAGFAAGAGFGFMLTTGAAGCGLGVAATGVAGFGTVATGAGGRVAAVRVTLRTGAGAAAAARDARTVRLTVRFVVVDVLVDWGDVSGAVALVSGAGAG